ncbi:hypothetical protein D9M72_323740 [compost metagenome]
MPARVIALGDQHVDAGRDGLARMLDGADQRHRGLAGTAHPGDGVGGRADPGGEDFHLALRDGGDLLLEQGLRAHVLREEVARRGRRHGEALEQAVDKAAMSFRNRGAHIFRGGDARQRGGQQQVHADRHVGAQRAQVAQLLRQFVGAVACRGIHAEPAGIGNGRGDFNAVREPEHRVADAQPAAQRVGQALVSGACHHCAPNRSGSKSRQGCCGIAEAVFITCRPIRFLWTSLVPSPIWFILASRRKRSIGYASR